MICAIDNNGGEVVAVAPDDMALADVLAIVPLDGVRASRLWRRPNRRGAEPGEVGVHVYRLAQGVPIAVGDHVDDMHRRDAFEGNEYLGFCEVSPK